jgi:hypothetical protein
VDDEKTRRRVVARLESRGEEAGVGEDDERVLGAGRKREKEQRERGGRRRRQQSQDRTLQIREQRVDTKGNEADDLSQRLIRERRVKDPALRDGGNWLARQRRRGRNADCVSNSLELTGRTDLELGNSAVCSLLLRLTGVPWPVAHDR